MDSSPSSLLHGGWSPEGERLHLLDVVPVVAGDPGQAALSDLNIAMQSEISEMKCSGVPTSTSWAGLKEPGLLKLS